MEHLDSGAEALNSAEQITDLTSTQQDMLDCTGCFAANDRELRPPDGVKCRGEKATKVREALGELQTQGLIYEVNPGKFKSYTITPLGEQYANPQEGCSVVNAEVPLVPALKRLLDCIGCLTTQGLPITNSELQVCDNDFNERQITRSLPRLIKNDLLQKLDGGGTSNAAYALTERGSAQATTSDAECKRPSNLTPKLTPSQQQLLDCLRCQFAKGRTPNTTTAVICTGASSSSVRSRADALIAKKMVAADYANQDALLGGDVVRTFIPLNTSSFPAKSSPDCTIEQKELQCIYGRLTARQRSLLGCLACIGDKITAGAMLPGATRLMLDECTKVKSQHFIEELVRDGFYTLERGFTKGYGQIFMQPTDRGLQLQDLNRQSLPTYDELYAMYGGGRSNCNVIPPTKSEAPIRIRNAIIKCVGCIWTQQAAAGKPLAVTAKMIASCSGLDQNAITTNTLPAMVEEGLMNRVAVWTNEGLPFDYFFYHYRPRIPLRILLGVGADCGNVLAEGGIDQNLLTAIPEVIINADTNAPAEDPASNFRKFEAYVDSVGAGETLVWLDEFTRKLIYDHPRLTAEEEAFLGMIIQKSSDRQAIDNAIDTLIQHNGRLALWMTRRLRLMVALTSFEDTFQSCLIGLGQAARTFDPLRGNKFSTHAYWRMFGAAQRNAHEHSRIPRVVIEQMPTMLRHTHTFKELHAKDPSVIELAVSMGKTIEQVQAIMDAYKSWRAKSLNAEVYDSGAALHEFVGQEEQGYESVGVGILFKRIGQFMTPQENDILREIVIGLGPVDEFAAKYQMDHGVVEEQLSRVRSIVRHPFFGLGRIYDARLLDWQERAQCFTEKNPGVVKGDPEAAEVCTRCPVQKQCADFATSASPPVTHSIWGGVLAAAKQSED